VRSSVSVSPAGASHQQRQLDRAALLDEQLHHAPHVGVGLGGRLAGVAGERLLGPGAQRGQPVRRGQRGRDVADAVQLAGQLGHGHAGGADRAQLLRRRRAQLGG
jgi:hypothetical protein